MPGGSTSGSKLRSRQPPACSGVMRSTTSSPAVTVLRPAGQTTVASLKDDGMKYAPVAYQGVESTLKMLKDSLAAEDYKAVLAGTPKLNEAVESLKTAIASGKEQFDAATAEWSTLSADVPKMVAAIQSRVDILSSSRKLPKNVNKEAFESAKSGLESMKSMWNEATASAANAGPVKARSPTRLAPILRLFFIANTSTLRIGLANTVGP